MEDELGPYILEHGITVDRQYIDNDAELEKRYGTRVPVLMFQNRIVCEYFLDPTSLLKEISAKNSG